MLLLLSADFFFIFKKKNLSGTLSEHQTFWIRIKTDILLVLIWVQTVCKGYQMTTKITASKERVKIVSLVENGFYKTKALQAMMRCNNYLQHLGIHSLQMSLLGDDQHK